MAGIKSVRRCRVKESGRDVEEKKEERGKGAVDIATDLSPQRVSPDSFFRHFKVFYTIPHCHLPHSVSYL